MMMIIKKIQFHPLKRFSQISFLLLIIYWLQYTKADSPSSGSAALTVVENADDTTQDLDGVSVEIEAEKNYEKFEATKEWKTVKEGQTLPSGLHVRLNLKTGKKEAKLIQEEGGGRGELEEEEEEEEEKNTDGLGYWKKADKEGMVNKNHKSFSRDELKDALKKFKEHKMLDEEKESLSASPQKEKKYKNYKKLKEDFEKINLGIKTEGEIVTDLLKRLKESENKEDLRFVLSELEYNLHKIDNALLFMDLGGMSDLVKLLNNTDPDLRHDTAFVLGSAMQSNPKVQITAMEAGILQRLITIVSTDPFMSVRKKALYALSAMIRHFPYAQKRFLSLGGLSVFSQLFTQPNTEKMRLQIITLLTDLNTEKIHSLTNLNYDNNLQKEKLKQYNEFDILSTMVKTGWCDKVMTLLELEDYDSQEKVLTIMKQIAKPCRSTFRPFSRQLETLESKYNGLCEADRAKENGEEEESSEFFCSIMETILNILYTIKHVKDEF